MKKKLHSVNKYLDRESCIIEDEILEELDPYTHKTKKYHRSVSVYGSSHFKVYFKVYLGDIYSEENPKGYWYESLEDLGNELMRKGLSAIVSARIEE